jgi:hypothetical protein
MASGGAWGCEERAACWFLDSLGAKVQKIYDGRTYLRTSRVAILSVEILVGEFV